MLKFLKVEMLRPFENTEHPNSLSSIIRSSLLAQQNVDLSLSFIFFYKFADAYLSCLIHNPET